MNDLLRRILFLPEQGSEYARSVDHLHFFVIITTMIAAAAVFGTALVFYIRFRRRSDVEPTPRVSPRAIHEVLFIGVPLTFFLVWFAIGFPQFVTLHSAPRNAMDVYVQGKQWMWKFAYPGGPSSLDVLRVPAGRPVRLLITSRDVIHSFFVPELRIKQDALPGRYTEIWFLADKPARYQILCTQYCGMGHSAMRADIVIMPAQEFDAWMAAQRRGITGAQDSNPVAFEDDPSGVEPDPRGRAGGRRARLPQVPLGGRHAPHRADLGEPLRPRREADHRQVGERRRGLPDQVDDGPGRGPRRRLPERDAHLPGQAVATRGGRHRRVHQVPSYHGGTTGTLGAARL